MQFLCILFSSGAIVAMIISYGSWIYNYLCNWCLSPLMWVWISIRARCTTLCDKVCQWVVAGRLFSAGTPVSSTNKTDCHDITEILLKVTLNTIKPTNLKKNKSYLALISTLPIICIRFLPMYVPDLDPISRNTFLLEDQITFSVWYTNYSLIENQSGKRSNNYQMHSFIEEILSSPSQ